MWVIKETWLKSEPKTSFFLFILFTTTKSQPFSKNLFVSLSISGVLNAMWLIPGPFFCKYSLIIEIDNVEIPILDGSAIDYYDSIKSSGIKIFNERWFD